MPKENPIKTITQVKNFIILIFIFVSFITLAYSGLFEYDLLGGTELNGSGCVCHTVERDSSVSVWIEGPDSLAVGQTGIYRMYLANGPAEAGGYNVAGRFGIMSLIDTLSYWHFASPNELTQAFPLVFPTPQDTIFWAFAYTAPDSAVIDTLYSCGLSLLYDGVPDFHDRWNFGLKFPITVYQNIVPVELISFITSINNNNVLLSWITATETNNLGFEIERASISASSTQVWERIGFVNGSGTTTETKSYSFLDEGLSTGKPAYLTGRYQYRLKQIDFNGFFEYLPTGKAGSNIVEVEILYPSEFILEQNYPNPFNPSTTISFSIPIVETYRNASLLTILKVFDVLGNEITTLVNEEKTAGNYSVKFDAKTLASGIYFYKLNVGKKESIKKMVLLR